MEKQLRLGMENNMITKFEAFDKKMPNDNYEIFEIVQNKDGLSIVLLGHQYKIKITFGFVTSFCVFDEGARIKSYNEIVEIQEYRKNKFKGNPLYLSITDTPFKNWLNDESCGFCHDAKHFMIVTINDMVDIASQFAPQIEVDLIG
ncbi:MAG: hypothetical protein K2J85_05915 [Anaeroplasmataceae bacterium]|nr:hypothetical protein [Anaeroplasmataceae bacterium]